MAVGVGWPSPNTATHSVGTRPVGDRRRGSLLGTTPFSPLRGEKGRG
jgi:hypothetical protein